MTRDRDALLALVAAATTGAYVTTAQLLARGALRHEVRRAVALGLLLPVACGLHLVPGARTDDLWVDRVGRCLTRLGPGAAAARHTAARLHGFSGSPAALGLEFVVPPTRRPTRRPGVSCSRAPLPREDLVTSHGGLLVTSPARTLIDCGRFGDRVGFVCVTEAALRHGVATVDELTDRLDALHRAPGVLLVRSGLALIDTLSESPLETALRILLLDAGLPQPVLQLPFLHSGLRGRIDLAYPTGRPRGRYVGLAIEADGRKYHDVDTEAFHTDRVRHTALEEAGWLVRRFTDRHVRCNAAYVAQVVRRALAHVAAG